MWINSYSVGAGFDKLKPSFKGEACVLGAKTREKAGTSEPVNNNVSFTGVPDTLAKKVPDTLLKSKFFHSALKLAERNAFFFEAAFVMLIATTIRPASILAVPGAKKEDKQYAAVKAIASGIGSFILACIIYMPLAAMMQRFGNSAKFASKAKDALKLAQAATKDPEKLKKAHEAAQHVINAMKYVKPDKTAKVLEQATKALTAGGSGTSVTAANKALTELTKICNFPFALGSKAFDAFNYFVNYGSRFIIGPLDAWFLFKLMPPIMKRMFPDRTKKKKPSADPMAFSYKLNSDQQRLLLQDFTKKFNLKGGQVNA